MNIAVQNIIGLINLWVIYPHIVVIIMQNGKIVMVLTVVLVTGLISTAQAQDTIPGWIKTSMGFWSDGITSDAEFINAIEFLIENDIVSVSSERSQTGDDPNKSYIIEDKRFVMWQPEGWIRQADVQDYAATKGISILKQDKAGFSALETKIFVEMYDFAKDETFESTYEEWYIDYVEILTTIMDGGHIVDHEEYVQIASGTLHPKNIIVHEVSFGADRQGTYNSVITIFEHENTMYVISYQASDKEYRAGLQTYQEIIETFKIVS